MNAMPNRNILFTGALLAALGPASMAEAGQTTSFPCRNMGDGRYLVDGPDFAAMTKTLGYRETPSYKVLKFTKKRSPDGWTNGICLFELEPND